MYYKTAQALSMGLGLLSLVGVLILSYFLENGTLDGSDTFVMVLLVIALSLLICAAVIAFMYYRCPFCRELLLSKGSLGQFCKHCGKRLY
ncbi:MAG: hypothetical protein FWE24_02190 [Defluviitaleaceae bacterium]|nr:hypothetical protein [Defluviitaleaceae bacterium]